jgi:hypothetical protein
MDFSVIGEITQICKLNPKIKLDCSNPLALDALNFAFDGFLDSMVVKFNQLLLKGRFRRFCHPDKNPFTISPVNLPLFSFIGTSTDPGIFPF